MEYQGQGWLDPASNAVYRHHRASTAEHPLCPVCEMEVDPATAPRSVYRDHAYYFCMPTHKALFDASPEAASLRGDTIDEMRKWGKRGWRCVLLWPLVALAAEVDLPELAVSLTALPVGADKPEVRQSGSGFEATTHVGAATLRIYRQSDPVPAGERRRRPELSRQPRCDVRRIGRFQEPRRADRRGRP